MNKSIQIRVNKIESYRDINGQLGKKIELVEEHEDYNKAVQPSSEEAAVIMGMMVSLQKQMPGIMQIPVIPKMILYLTEEEYDSLGVTLDVNQTYQVTFESQTIKISTQQREPET